MRKLYYILVICFFVNLSFFGQTTLTNGMVYNYSVGDTIQYRVPNAMCGVNPPYDRQLIVLQKTVSVNHIDYVVLSTTVDGCGGCAGPNWNSVNTVTMSINNADSLAKHQSIYYNSICITSQSVYTDTTYVATYGKITDRRKFQTTSNVGGCSVNYGFSYLIEGIGEFYTLVVNQNGDPCNYAKTLMFAHKVGEAPIGSRLLFPVGVRELNELDGISVFPNPSIDGEIYVSNEKMLKVNISITTLEGQLIYKEESNLSLIKIDKEIAPGIYFVKCQKGTAESVVKKLIVY